MDMSEIDANAAISATSWWGAPSSWSADWKTSDGWNEISSDWNAISSAAYNATDENVNAAISSDETFNAIRKKARKASLDAVRYVTNVNLVTSLVASDVTRKKARKASLSAIRDATGDATWIAAREATLVACKNGY